MPIVLLAALVSLLPFWRDSMHPNEGRNLWEFYADTHSQEYIDSHIPFEDAVDEAREAYRSCSRINRRAS
jgi:hypothetical protein